MDNKQKVEGGLLGVLVLVIIIGGYLWYSSSKSAPAPVAPPVVQKPVSDVKVTTAQMNTTTSTLSLPVGFPTNIPVEVLNITESYTAEYKSAGFVQYTITYTSDKTVASKWLEYKDFLTKAGYTLGKEGTNQAQGTVYGKKGMDEMSVLVATQNKKTTVHISVLQKK
jgi:hypothetical protein